jgi:hypothetical protein
VHGRAREGAGVIDGGHIPANRHRLTARDVARRLGVGERRVRLIPPDELPYLALTAGGRRRYAPEDVERFLARRIVRG